MVTHTNNEISYEQGKYQLHDLGEGIKWAVFGNGIIFINSRYEAEYKRQNPEAIRA